jgi:hypothetical protein
MYGRSDDDCKKQSKHVARLTIKEHYKIVVTVIYLLNIERSVGYSCIINKNKYTFIDITLKLLVDIKLFRR